MEKGWFVVIKHLDQWLLDVYSVPYENNIHQYYKELDCDVFDIINAEVYVPYITGDPDVVVVCDDNGKLMNKYPTLPVFQYGPDHKVIDVVDVLVGDLGFCHRDETDPAELRGFDDVEKKELILQIKHYLRHYTKFKINE